jgi:general secretion pathway protein C
MIAIGSYFVADMANLIIGSRLEASIEIPKTGAPKGIVAREGAASDYASIVEGNIFNSKMRGRRPEMEQSAQPVPAAPRMPLNLNLVGTMVGTEEGSYAILEDTKTREQFLYHLGDLLAEDAKLVQISRNKVVIRRGSEKEILEVSLDPENKPQAPGPTPVAVAPGSSASHPGGSIRQVSTNRWVLDRREIEGAVDNLPQLLTKARIIPNFADGKPDGFRIFAITEDSLYAKIGLQNGDVLHRVNGIEVKDPQNFLKVFQQLKDETSVTVDLARNNQKETFSYEIR